MLEGLLKKQRRFERRMVAAEPADDLHTQRQALLRKSGVNRRYWMRSAITMRAR